MVRAPGSRRAVTASKKISAGSQGMIVDQVKLCFELDIQQASRVGQIPARDYKAASRLNAWIADFKFVMSEPGLKRSIPLLLALLLAVALKTSLLLAGAIPFNSDEAVVALMARHILQGERPLFFYGQAYMGSLDAWLVAGAFRVVGESVLAVRIVQIVIYALYLCSLWLLAKDLFTDRRVAPLVVALAAVPTVLVTTYTTASLGGYGEALVLGNLMLWLGYRIAWGDWHHRRLAWVGLGLAAGLAFWTLGLAVIYLVPVALGLILKWRKGDIWYSFLALVGFLLGSLPWWAANLSGGWTALRVLLQSGAGDTTPGEHLIALLLLGLPVVIGLRFPWQPDFTPLPLLFTSLLFYLSAMLYIIIAMRKGRLPLKLAQAFYWGLSAPDFVLIFILTRFGIDATGRYLLPMNLLLLLVSAVFIAAVWRWRVGMGISLLILVLALNSIATWRAASASEGITTQFDPQTRFDNSHDQELMRFLRQAGETRGYTNYWVSFRLAFLSAEELIFAARLPYKGDLSYAPSDNRYPAYSKSVDESQRVAYITSQQPSFDAVLRQKLVSLGVDFSEKQIGVYRVFYDLSKLVRPEQLGLEAVQP